MKELEHKMNLRIKNWHKFQHFKNRKPPWIKLYKEILDQRDIMAISGDAFKFLVCLWLIGSEDEEQKGTLPSVSDIAFRLRLSESKVCAFLKQVDIFLISDRYQDDETETETEREKEKEKEERQRRFTKPTQQEVSDYCKEIGFKQDAQAFIDYYESKGWMIGKNNMKDWKATVRNWSRRSDQPQEAKKPQKPDYTRYIQEIRDAAINYQTITAYVGAMMDKYSSIPGFEPDKYAIPAWKNRVKLSIKEIGNGN
jgi:hypothetical protein